MEFITLLNPIFNPGRRDEPKDQSHPAFDCF